MISEAGKAVKERKRYKGRTGQDRIGQDRDNATLKFSHVYFILFIDSSRSKLPVSSRFQGIFTV